MNELAELMTSRGIETVLGNTLWAWLNQYRSDPRVSALYQSISSHSPDNRLAGVRRILAAAPAETVYPESYIVRRLDIKAPAWSNWKKRNGLSISSPWA